MHVTYIGAHDAVLVDLPGGREVEVERDASIEVPDDLGARLLEQPANWRRTKPAAVDKPDVTGDKE